MHFSLQTPKSQPYSGWRALLIFQFFIFHDFFDYFISDLCTIVYNYFKELFVWYKSLNLFYIELYSNATPCFNLNAFLKHL